MDELLDLNILRAARERRGLSIAEIAAATTVSERMLQLIDTGQFDRLPRGFYARAFVRAYAGAVGIDPEEALRMVGGRLPDADASFAEIVEVRLKAQGGPARVTRLPAVIPRRALVPILDGTILSAIAGLCVLSTAAVCQVRPALLPGTTAPAVGLLWGVIALSYFGLLAGVTGRTPGGWIAGVAPAEGPRRTDLAGVLRRARQCVVTEASLVVELMVGESLTAARTRESARSHTAAAAS